MACDSRRSCATRGGRRLRSAGELTRNLPLRVIIVCVRGVFLTDCLSLQARVDVHDEPLGRRVELGNDCCRRSRAGVDAAELAHGACLPTSAPVCSLLTHTLLTFSHF